MADRAESENPSSLAETTAGPARRVFISYASHDAAVAQKVCSVLERAGFRCWMAPRDVVPGMLYADGIVRAINESTILVLILSESAVASAHVGKELERASSKRHPILALRTDSAPLPPAFEYFLSESQWIDVGTGGTDAAIASLVGAVRQHLLPGAATTTPPSHGASGIKYPAATPRRTWVIAGTVVVIALAGAYFFANKVWLHGHSALAVRVGAGTSETVSDKSIAVLPFTDMSEKRDQEYFGDGMAEEILDLLVKIPGLTVIGRTSSFQFKGKNEDLRTIGMKLNASYVLEGSVRNSGDQVRITAQLINTRTGAHEWSETYDRPIGDVLKTQDEIAGNIARALQIAVGADSLQPRPTLSHPEAYQAYLQGKHALDRYNKEGFDEAISYFQQALDLDPTFADAAMALSLAYEMQANFDFVPPAVGYERARQAAEAALKLDHSLALAHAVLGVIAVVYDWDWATADRELQLALKLKPHDPFALASAGTLELALGHYDNAARMFKETVARDPLYVDNYQMLSWAQIRLGQVTEAIGTQKKVLEIQPGAAWGYTYLSVWLLLRGDLQAALAAIQREDPAIQAGGFSIIYWALGRKEEADAKLTQFIAEQANSNAYGIAWTYAYRGNRNEAFKWLERAYTQKDAGLFLIKGEPLLTNLESDPRYKAFLKKMKLPE